VCARFAFATFAFTTNIAVYLKFNDATPKSYLKNIINKNNKNKKFIVQKYQNIVTQRSQKIFAPFQEVFKINLPAINHDCGARPENSQAQY
jgi:hypothetical protein